MQTGGMRQDVADLRQTRPEMSQLRDVLMGVMAGIPGGMADASPIGMLPRMVEGRSYTDELGEMLGADTQSGEFLAGQFASPDPLDALKVAKLAPGMEQVLEAMTLFHGSPHKWNKVDLSKVGTGEGVQAFGHGFYGAEKRDIAEHYARKLGDPGGHVYELDLSDEVAEKMLDWDALIDDQPGLLERLRKTDWWSYAEEGIEDRASRRDRNPIGEDLYKYLEEEYSPEEISVMLDDLGIPGIKYFDATSRDARDGTRNFVVFNEKYIKPLKRNGEVISE